MTETTDTNPGAAAAAPTPFSLRVGARSPKAFAAVSLWFSALAALGLFVQAAPWVLGLLALPGLPAVFELIRNPQSDLRLDQQRLSWDCPRNQGDIGLSEIEKVVMTTRWDFSTAISVRTKPGSRHSLPPQLGHAHRALEEALRSHQIHVERHHFIAS